MLDVIRDAWPWVLLAFLIGLFCGWYVTLGWCRDQHPRTKSGPAPAMDFAAASKVVGAKVKLDDLVLIEGIGPKISTLLKADGITTWASLAGASVARLKKVLDAAGPHYSMHDPKTWPKQASLLAEGKWAEFKTLTDKLVGGR
jgi:predicted flap endonuclease-1-like 5' DNA nuclease